MLNVHDYINEHNCLTSVSAAYNPMQGAIPHPYLVKGQYFDVSLNGRSNDKHHLSFAEFVELLVNPSRHPSARVRCKRASGTFCVCPDASIRARALQTQPLGHFAQWATQALRARLVSPARAVER